MSAHVPVMRCARVLAVTLAVAVVVPAMQPQPASAGVCGAVGVFAGWAGRACSAVSHPEKLIKVGKSLATGHVGQAIKGLVSSSTGQKALGLAALVTWVLVGARSALNATAGVIQKTTTPQLRSTWFSATYWRMAGVAALLTVPFLFAAAAQAMMRSDLALLARAALGYLPLSLLAVGIAAPLTMLLLAATDEMATIVSSAAGQAGSRFLTFAGQHVATFDPGGHSPFLTFLIAVLACAAAIVLWIEMAMRGAAIYIVVLMLPLAFAAMVWPARRVWAVRSAELLVVLVLSKFAVVAIIALGGAALGPTGGASGLLAGLVLVTLAAFSPWALLRVLPLAELAGGAMGHLRTDMHQRVDRLERLGEETGGRVSGWVGEHLAKMRRDAEANGAGGQAEGSGSDAAARGVREKLAETAAQGDAFETGGTAGAGDADGTAEAAGRTPSRADSGSPVADSDAGSVAGSVADPDADSAPHANASHERSPGMSDYFQADDDAAPEVPMHPDGFPTRPLAPERNGAMAGTDAATAGRADDADPLPPEQEPEGGRL